MLGQTTKNFIFEKNKQMLAENIDISIDS